MNAPEGERLFTEIETMERLRLKSRLVLWRLRRRGAIGHFVFGRRIYYSETHIREYLSRCERRPEGQRAVAA